MKHYSTYQSQFIEMFGDPNKGNWTASVADYCYILGGFAFKSDLFSSTGVPIVRISNINDGVVDIDQSINYGYDFWVSNPSYRVLDGDILMAMSGATTGKVGVFRQNVPALLNQRVACIRQKEGKSVSSFLYAALQSEFMYKTIQSSAQGGAQPNISSKQISKLPMPAANILDQKKFESIAQQADKSKFTSLKSQFIEMIGSKNWPEAKLKDIVHEDCSISYGIVQPGDDIEDGVPIVRPVDMNDTHLIERESLKKTSREISDAYSRTILRGDEILICVRGTTGLISKAEGLQGCNVTRGITPLFFKPEYNKEYLYRAFLGEKVQTYIKDNTIGSTLKGINMGTLREMPVCIPTCDIQQKFVCIAEQADKSKYIN